ncbi:MAG: T9SS type A sorting domain-containing protein [Bacteroidales bacterium]|nr:MAG: T9SS type A sorting domain-containing protein [Bacteroidales bacterium]UCH15701.1 MAG: T9SS type A sorting domain-containing protein [Bacteroidales bacterium]
MKTLILWMLVLTIASISSAQYVDIPDANFKNALIEAGVDADKDSEISYVEADAVTTLVINIYPADSIDVKGIEVFTNLDTLVLSAVKVVNLDISNCTSLRYLSCQCGLTSIDVSKNTELTILAVGMGMGGGNNLDSLDVSNNTALQYLNCQGNQLTSLDVSNNTALLGLYCGYNRLINLDISNSVALMELFCYENQLTSLDISGCTALTWLQCGSNQLTRLDVSDKISLDVLAVANMPTLYEVCVWDMPFPTVGVDIDTTSSPNIKFTTDCAVNDLKAYKESNTIDIYPNPSDNIINIEIENKNKTTIEIYNVSGKIVFSKKLNSKKERIDISGLSEGMYFVKVTQEQDVMVEKLIVY